MKTLNATIVSLLLAGHLNSQNLNLPPADTHDSSVDLSSSQITGCAFLGLGIATIGYTAAKTHSNKYPALWYTGGSILATAGILILIFGDKEPQVKYWKGMESYLPPLQDNSCFSNQGYNMRLPFSPHTIRRELAGK